MSTAATETREYFLLDISDDRELGEQNCAAFGFTSFTLVPDSHDPEWGVYAFTGPAESHEAFQRFLSEAVEP